MKHVLGLSFTVQKRVFVALMHARRQQEMTGLFYTVVGLCRAERMH